MELILAAEAADLDSFCCAEFLRSYHAEQGRKVRALLPVPREELEWRPDIREMVGYLGATGWRNRLDFSNEFPLALLDDEGLSLHLVDRHHLPTEWVAGRPWLVDRVEMVLDHRPDTGELASARTRVLEPVASCATLLYERFGCGSGWQPLLLAAAVLQDSELLASPRTTGRDRAAAVGLRARLAREEWDWLQALPELRARSSLLPARQQLGQDVKWTRSPRIPVAVVQVDAAFFWSLPGVVDAVEHLAAEDGGVVLVLHKPPRPALRELSVWSGNRREPEWLNALLAWPEAGWREKRRAAAGSRVFVMGNSSLTRKDVLFRMECILARMAGTGS